MLLKRLDVGPDGRFIVEAQGWGDYWEPVLALGHAEVMARLERLHDIWGRYIRDGLAPSLRREYCFRYFALLDSTLADNLAKPASPPVRSALQRVLGFECLGIAAAGYAQGPVAAATTSLRNPCYLLTKLKTPDALDDCQFLPLIPAGDGQSPGLFYQYRQHRLCVDSENSILLYLSADQGARGESFRVINALEQQIGLGTDPRGDERALRIAERVVIPYLTHGSELQGPRSDAMVDIELVDVGSGSGILSARLCQQVRRSLANRGTASRFRVWMVDLTLSDPSRFFGGRQLRSSIDCVAVVGSDYRRWLAARERLPRASGARIGLVSRFFNNLSDFSVGTAPAEELADSVGWRGIEPEWGDCLPTRCLGPDGRGPEALDVSNARVWLDAGRTFAQASLSRYFEGLFRLTASGNDSSWRRHDSDAEFFALRSLRPECLLTGDGDSVLERLLDDCSLVVLQDADMRPQDLLAHRQRIRSPEVVAVDMTRSLGLKGHFSYALLRVTDPGLESLKGERLW
ncbi:MAG: hypothetical protein FJ290_14870 [Planctomycetes bacterium]|nr:hypothetical protein [Planctomycetota bacterium]